MLVLFLSTDEVCTALLPDSLGANPGNQDQDGHVSRNEDKAMKNSQRMLMDLLNVVTIQRDELLESLQDLVSFYDYKLLDKGCGTNTVEGKAWMRARTKVRNCNASKEVI